MNSSGYVQAFYNPDVKPVNMVDDIEKLLAWSNQIKDNRNRIKFLELIDLNDKKESKIILEKLSLLEKNN